MQLVAAAGRNVYHAGSAVACSQVRQLLRRESSQLTGHSQAGTCFTRMQTSTTLGLDLVIWCSRDPVMLHTPFSLRQ